MKEGNKDRPRNNDVNSKGCWTCGGPHLAKASQNRERVNALLAGKLNQGKEEEEVVAAMENLLGLSFNHIMLVNNVEGAFNALTLHASLFNIEIKVKEQHVMAMADTRATHTFVDIKIAAKLVLKLTKSTSNIKTVNSKAQSIVDMAYGFVPFPHLDGIMIMNKGNSRFVKGVYPFGNVHKVSKKKDTGMLLSTMLIDKGLKKGNETIHAALVELKLDVTVEMPDCVA
ncbi:hypothetical protein KY290_012887 [Solanum tuberosum]|uniref:Gag-pol polyprotein n=1 Tax=Solanum tuberosum TaxID=4113 RepID=A0ABQ7VK45_SOLTU|nr:hypothetical protein KY285_012637 [Solanum tuberosum]KAH0768906.1 hypothetical protein KY290_012887 [Solanum tuberosum]